ncbi:MAG: hypothetical protein WB629_09590, partial [Candidatus Sulfotelmatobacter sp.]
KLTSAQPAICHPEEGVLCPTKDLRSLPDARQHLRPVSAASGKIVCGFLAEIKFAEFLPETGGFALPGYTPPPPGCIGIIALARKSELIYGAQSLAGKILMSKNLQVEILVAQAPNGTMRSLRTVTASIMIARLGGWAQG